MHSFQRDVDHAEKMDEWQRTVLKINCSNEEFYRCYNQGIEHGRIAIAVSTVPITWCSCRPPDYPGSSRYSVVIL